MGIFRLLLSVAVLLSHTGISVFGVNEGVVAVISFYLLSGFVMTALISKHYPHLSRIGFFYVDRAARLCPQFYIYLIITIAVIVLLRPESQANTIVDVKGIIESALFVPLNFYMYLLADRIYMPQTWSLGAEVVFYIVFPFILFARARVWVLIVSVAVFLVAFSGRIDSDVFGYRLLPGTLFIFVLGSWIYDARFRRVPAWLVTAWCVALLLFFVTFAIETVALPYNREVSIGLVIGLPLMWLLRHQPSSHFDAFAGNLSYGIFLNHNAIIFFLQSRHIDVSKPAWAVGVVLVATSCAYLSYRWIERPFLRLRRSMRAPSNRPRSDLPDRQFSNHA